MAVFLLWGQSRWAVGRALQHLRDCFAPGASGAVYGDVAYFSYFNRAAQTTDEYIVWFDLLRRKVEYRAQPAGASAPAFTSALRLQSASLPRADKSLVLASVNGGMGAINRAATAPAVRPGGLKWKAGRRECGGR